MSVDQVIESILKLREILALAILGGVIWMIVSRLIPMLISHKDQTLADTLNSVREAMDGIRTAIAGLSQAVQGNTTIIAKLEDKFDNEK